MANAPPDLPASATAARADLLRWYDAHRRELPWRDADDAYAVWVSEIMLQQTRVETVRGYFTRWMERFPTVDALAEAAEDDVLHAWQGLGYYSRARNLHRAAKAVAEAGALPTTADGWRALPGVGPYTAGAVASIAFGEQAALVDGNVLRVFARWFGLDGDIGRSPTQRAIWALAEQWVRGERPGDFNQGLMELGATVCAPRSPRCAACPIAASCVSLHDGGVTRRPVKAKKQKQRPERRYAFLLRDDAGRWLLGQRPPEGLLGGLWEPPLSAPAGGDWREAWTAAGGGAGAEGVVLDDVVHVFSHIRLTATPVIVDGGAAPALTLPYAAWDWVDAGRWDELATSKLANKLRAAFENGQATLHLR